MRLIDADKADIERINCFYSSECHIEDVQEWLDEQPTVNPYEWISVEDRLPEASGACIVCRFSGYVYKTFFSGTFPKAITHWMPLPAPPTEKEN